jgi:hypothetical protein
MRNLGLNSVATEVGAGMHIMAWSKNHVVESRSITAEGEVASSIPVEIDDEEVQLEVDEEAQLEVDEEAQLEVDEEVQLEVDEEAQLEVNDVSVETLWHFGLKTSSTLAFSQLSSRAP